jgi:hypothetical protein
MVAEMFDDMDEEMLEKMVEETDAEMVEEIERRDKEKRIVMRWLQ